MPLISTRFTALLGVKTPIALAPMGGIVRAEMVVEITKAGGFGFLGTANDSPQLIVEQFQIIRSQLGLGADDVLPVGIGFIGWVLDRTEVSDDPRLERTLAEKPKAIWFAFGTDLSKHVRKVQEYDAKREHKTLIFVLVNNVEDALKAANEWKVDGLVVQGGEAGGHGSADAPPLSVLMSAILSVLPEDGPVLVAAGGIATGAQIASVLTLGAAGAVLGTRFLLTHEAIFMPLKKQILLEAGLNSTARSMAFDEVNRSMFWPQGIDGRAIANKIIEDEKDGHDMEERLKRHDEGKANGQKDRQVVWAGVGAGLTTEIKSTSEVVAELHAQTVQALKRVSTLVPPT
ncbi:hypothetical protein AAF712_004680 [Marasmius tenuissimus]|uniref:Nitronate monooxygenase domain-containing protein n=1 Tax=Marasmius tenuissimus TaxID=585030 RepID=A0ABR3A3S3_9AGAR